MLTTNSKSERAVFTNSKGFTDTPSLLRKKAKQCGIYPIAKRMQKEGYSLQEALSILVYKQG